MNKNPRRCAVRRVVSTRFGARRPRRDAGLSRTSGGAPGSGSLLSWLIYNNLLLTSGDVLF
ncbi:MAG: hypothetical protein OIN66_17230 [Candidatus Methanoperedens sp.]|nr:hypothetical protein [Candidatus Methanoperedens sp.]